MLVEAYFYCNGAMLVRVADPYEGRKYYMKGIASPTCVEYDCIHVANWGSTFPKDIGNFMFERGHFNIVNFEY